MFSRHDSAFVTLYTSIIVSSNKHHLTDLEYKLVVRATLVDL